MKKLLIGLLAVGAFSTAFAQVKVAGIEYINTPMMAKTVKLSIDGPKLSDAEVIEKCESSAIFQNFKDYAANKSLNVIEAYCDEISIVGIKKKTANPYARVKSNWAVSTKGYVYQAKIKVLFSDLRN